MAEENEHIDVIHLKKNKGKANAISQGYFYLKDSLLDDDIFSYFDADLSVSLETFNELSQFLDKCPVVIGSRLETDNNTVEKKTIRKMIGRSIAFWINIILPHHIYDTQCGAKLFKGNILHTCLSSTFICHWLFDVELLLRLKPEDIIEVPINWRHVKGSKIGFKSIPIVILDLLKLSYLRIKCIILR